MLGIQSYGKTLFRKAIILNLRIIHLQLPNHTVSNEIALYNI